MNSRLFPRRFPWLPAVAILTFSGALFLCNWLVWTPIQRYYLGTYLKCAWLGTDPASSAEIRWVYKTAPHGKQELALDADVVPSPSGGDLRISMLLSPAARQAGWTGLMQGPEEWLPTVRLQPFLEAQFYAGESIWRMLLTPLLWASAMFFFLLAGWSMLSNRSPNKRLDRETIEWGGPSPNLLQRWRTKLSRVRFRLPGFAEQRMPEILPKPTPAAPAIAVTEPLKKPAQPVLAILGSKIGAPNGKLKERFIWEETKGIE
jgi:hypothetical protein